MHPELVEFLARFVSPHKLRRFDEVLARRTRHLTVVLEDIFQQHNASACLRTCDCFGVQDVHVIENRYDFAVSRDVALGASQWLTVRRYRGEADNTLTCIRALKRQGYRVMATTPSDDACPLDAYDAAQKTALMFGTEMDGLSPTALEHADGLLTIPLCGFTESLNLSVALALCLNDLTNRLRRLDMDWELTDEEKFEIRGAWVRTVLKKRFKQHEAAFYRRCAAEAGLSSRRGGLQ